MNSAQLLSHFDRISEASDAIPRLRRFILDLAVRGKLVEQDPRDEPASELFKRIQTEKARLVQAGEIKTGKPLPDIDEDDSPFRIPASWRWVRLNGITSYIQRGKSPKYAAGEGLPVISQKCVQWGGLELESAKLITRDSIEDYESIRFLRSGDLLWNSTGTGTIGRIIRVKEPPPRLVCDGHVTVVRCLEVDAEYVRSWLRSDHVYAVIEDRAAGSTNQVELTSQLAMNQVVPLPPLAEQQRIVAKVDELMALCDRLEAVQAEREGRRDRLVASSLNRLDNGADPGAFRDHARFYFNHLPRLTTKPEHIQQLRQTILNLAVRGQLVPQDSNDEPASELLKRIQAEKVRLGNEGTIKRLQPALPIGLEEIPSAVPDGWEWVRVRDLLLGDTQNGYSKKPNDALDGIPILRISAGTVRKDGVVAEEEHKLIGGISAAQHEQYSLQPDDLLACRFNGNRSFVGRLTIYLGYLGLKPIYPDKLIRLRLLSQFALPKLVRCFAESSVVRREIENYCATTVGNWGISASNLKEIRIPLPPLAEQERIVAKVDELMALCDRLESQLTTTQTESRRLLEAVLHEALSVEKPNAN